MRVLRLFGITMITSANAAWTKDPFTYVISVESADGTKIYGGGRIQIAGGELKLPIETAVADKDPSIGPVISEYARTGTGEICGLWNSREMAIYGIGSIYLGRAIVAVAKQLNLSSLFALCAPATVRNCLRVGYEIAEFLGNKGIFYYPKDNLVATAMVIRDLDGLSTADDEERTRIFELKDNPVQQKLEPGPKGRMLDLHYELAVSVFNQVHCLA